MAGDIYIIETAVTRSLILFICFIAAAVLSYVTAMSLNVKLIPGQDGQIYPPYLKIEYDHVMEDDTDSNSTVTVCSVSR